VLGLVQDEPALRAGAASGILDKTLCAALSRRQVGSKEWVLFDLTKECNLGLAAGQATSEKPRYLRVLRQYGFSSGGHLTWPI